MIPRVVIIGAGVSGLSAAQKLCRSGKCDVTILEAEDRIGGRVHTIDFHGHKIELGAQWIHGSEGNAVYELLSKNLGESALIQEGERYYSDEASQVVYASSRKVTAEVRELFDETPGLLEDIEIDIAKQFEDKNVTQDSMKDVTLFSIARRIWEEKYLSQKRFENLDKSQTDPIFDSVMMISSITDAGVAEDVGCLMYYNYIELETPDVMISGGYSQLLDSLQKSIPESVINLESKVKCIHWNQAQNDIQIQNGVVNGSSIAEGVCGTQNGTLKLKSLAQCCDASGNSKTQNGVLQYETCVRDCMNGSQREVVMLKNSYVKHSPDNNLLNLTAQGISANDAIAFNSADGIQNGGIMVEYSDNALNTCALYADHVIVTVSLGCLKRYHETLFEPKLPIEKQSSLEKMGFGDVNKILLYYDKKFWDENDFPIYFLWDSYQGIDQFSNVNHWCRKLHSIESIQDHFLIVWLNETASKIVNDLDKDEVAKTLIDLLRKFKSDVTVPHPDDVIITNWGGNNNFMGSYSHTGVGEILETKRILAEPLYEQGVPKVLFAGEAMHETRFSTVDAAYLSGIKEAGRLLQHFSE